MNSNDEECSICMDSPDFITPMCGNNHNFCLECLNVHYEHMISEGNITNNCPECKTEFFDNQLEAFLNEGNQLASKKDEILGLFSFPTNFKIMTCPVCPNKVGSFLINEKDYIQYYDCEACKKRVCLFCLKECLSKSEHSLCMKYHKIALDFEKLIELAIRMECLECNKFKKLDLCPKILLEKCTHIKCLKCQMDFCYICGGHQEKVGKSEVEDNKSPIFRHNVDWENKSDRCPMWVNKFRNIYPDWPINSAQAGMKLFQYKISVYLKKIIEKHGISETESAYNHFKSKRLNCVPEDNFLEGLKTFKHYPIIDNKILQFFKI